MQLARVKSGFNAAQTQFNMATHDLQRATLTATVLENELGFINIGDNMKIVPFSMPEVEVTAAYLGNFTLDDGEKKRGTN